MKDKQPNSKEDIKSLYAGIGIERGVNQPGGIRIGIAYQTPSEAPSQRTE